MLGKECWGQGSGLSPLKDAHVCPFWALSQAPCVTCICAKRWDARGFCLPVLESLRSLCRCVLAGTGIPLWFFALLFPRDCFSLSLLPRPPSLSIHWVICTRGEVWVIPSGVPCIHLFLRCSPTYFRFSPLSNSSGNVADGIVSRHLASRITWPSLIYTALMTRIGSTPLKEGYAFSSREQPESTSGIFS